MERRPEGRHTSMGGEGVARIGDARTIFVVNYLFLQKFVVANTHESVGVPTGVICE